MRWQTIARLAIAAFVIVFTAVVFVALRRSSPPQERPTTPRSDPGTVAEIGRLTHTQTDDQGKVRWTVDAERQLTYPDGRTVFRDATVTLPDDKGQPATITAGEMEVIAPADGERQVSTVKGTHGVKLQTAGGLHIQSAEATYDENTGILTVPGEVQFTRDRLSGSGVGATYDRGRDVIWLLDRATIDVRPDAAGRGVVHATAGAAGLARAEHYIRLTRDAHLVSDGRTLDADELTVQLTSDDRLIQSMTLRGNSRITGFGGSSGAEAMSARDIDLLYAPDGRTLQHARLMENARVQLGQEGEATRTIAARSIEMSMAPDGATVTKLNATEAVQVELPGADGQPSRRINSASLVSGGGAAGLQSATFAGGVTYHELRPGVRGTAAGERTGRSRTLIVETAPGLGDIRQADFRGNVHIVDGPTAAEGSRAVYRVAQETFELMPSPADQGPPSSVNDGRVVVRARTIVFNPTTRKLHADTDVRSSFQPAQDGGEQATGRAAGQSGGAGREGGGKLPSLFKEEEPVNVTSNRLEYDGAAATGIYTGDARLFQGQTTIQADTIVIDDRTANLTARGRVRTVMFFEETDSRTKTKQLVQTTATGDTLVYDDASRLATYTTGPSAKAHIVGTQGDVTADRIQLFLKEGASELERAEADVNVTVKEGPRTATGSHLTYTPADETYVMTGAPVEIEEKNPGDCRVTLAASVTFRRSTVDMRIKNNGISPVTVRQCAGS